MGLQNQTTVTKQQQHPDAKKVKLYVDWDHSCFLESYKVKQNFKIWVASSGENYLIVQYDEKELYQLLMTEQNCSKRTVNFNSYSGYIYS